MGDGPFEEALHQKWSQLVTKEIQALKQRALRYYITRYSDKRFDHFMRKTFQNHEIVSELQTEQEADNRKEKNPQPAQHERYKR